MKPFCLAALMAAVAALSAQSSVSSPDACTVLTMEDVTTTMGAGWTVLPKEARTRTDNLTTCSYYHGTGNLVSFSLFRASNGNAKKSVASRQVNAPAKYHAASIPELCEGGFSEDLGHNNITVIAAHGVWQVQMSVLKGNVADLEAAKVLVAAACKRM